MVNNWKVVGVWDKRESNKTVYALRMSLAVFRQNYSEIRRCDLWLQYPPFEVDDTVIALCCVVETSNSPMVADLVESFKTSNIAPDFLRHNYHHP